MSALFIAQALVPAFCEEAIRSSYLFFLGERGSRRGVVLALGIVFVIGEILYDISLYPTALRELGADLAIPLLAVAVMSGAALHIALTVFTARQQRNGGAVWMVFAIAIAIHSGFNFVAITLLGVWI
jgi:hypothetical protein